MDTQLPLARWVDRLRHGDHVCWVYETEAERRSVLTSLVQARLKRQEKAVCVAADGGAHAAGWLRHAGVDVDAALTSGQIALLPAGETFLRAGAFHAEGLLAFWQDAASRAVAEGFAGVLVIAEMGPAVLNRVDPDSLVEYEARLNTGIAEAPCIAVCQFRRNETPARLLHALLQAHPSVVLGEDYCRNPYYLPPDVLLGPDRDEAELRRWLDDLAAHTRHLEALRVSEERYRAIVESQTDLVCRIRTDGTLTFANAAYCRYWGAPLEELLGLRVCSHMVEEDRARARSCLSTLGSTRPTGEIEVRVVRPDGNVAWVHWVVHAILDAEGNVVEIQGVGRDVTQRKALEEEVDRYRCKLEEVVAARTAELRSAYERLKAEQERKDRFLATLAHELRNPLGAIHSAVHLLGLRRSSGRSLEPALDVLQRQVRHMGRLLDDLLDVSRVVRGKVVLRKVMVEMGDAVRQAMETVRPLIDANRHTLNTLFPEEPVTVCADPTRLEQIIANLLSNAAKYTMPEGEITVSLETEGPSDGRQAVLRVRDTGIGISPELLPHVFDLFVQGSDHPGASPGGLGIGLTLVRDLVELHGGTVEAHSDGVGHGSEFVVRLPVAAATPDPAPVASAPGLPGVPPSLRVLLVEDDPDQAGMLAGLLRSSGHEVCVARDGPDGLRMAHTFGPQVVLLDVGLPGMDGYDVARRIRESGAHPRPLLVALTGYGLEADQLRAGEAGFDFHLTKPVDLAALQAVLFATPAATPHAQRSE